MLGDPADDYVRAQGLVVEATVPSGFTADRVRWLVESQDPNDPQAPIQPLWQHESAVGIDPGTAGPYTVRFGAPGLIELYDTWIRVSFRRASDQKWLCWSQRGTAFQTPAFPTLGPNAPSQALLTVEDQFRRPATQPKKAGGDGMGPDAVWMDNFPGVPAGNQPRIDADEEHLLMPASVAYYERLQATHPHSYAEVQFIPAGGATSYNFAVMARVIQQGMSMNFYQAKLVKQHLDVCFPTLFILKLSELEAFEQMPPLDPETQTCRTCADFAFLPSDACKQMQSGDPEPNLPSDPIWLRIEVDDNAQDEPVIVGTMAWNCGNGVAIEECSGLFQQTRTETGDPEGMAGLTGRWALESHDIGHLVDIFRAGTEDPAQP